MSQKLELTIATWDYDRVRAIFDGRIPIEGCNVNCFPLGPEETFWRAFKSHEFDVTELSFSSYMMSLRQGGCGYLAIPVFLSRVFRHSAFYVRSDSGISSPQDLRGREVGVPEYQMTAALWARGLLQDEYGVGPQDIVWRNGGLEETGRHEKVPLQLPESIIVRPIGDDQTLSGMLASGELQALITPRAPSCYEEGHPDVVRLFPDYRSAEQDYFRRTGLFPIMHVVAIREALVDAYPWLANSVYKAFSQAKDLSTNDLRQVAALKVTLPWITAELEDTIKLMGEDYWPYGIAQNQKALKAALRYSYEHGLIDRKLQVEELFVPSTLEVSRV